MTLLRVLVVLGATLTTGLTAGLFAAFSYAVMPGLARSDDRTFVVAMQQINRVILNIWFVACFVGALLLTILAVLLHLPAEGRAVLPWLGVALLLYLTVLGTTRAVNLPLNDALDAAAADDHAGAHAAREHFEARWVRWNVVRAVSSTAAFVVLAWALVLTGRLGT